MHERVVVRVKTTEFRGLGSESLQHLQAMIPTVTHDDAPLAVNRNAPRRVELPITTAFAANGSNVRGVVVAQQLHVMAVAICYNDVAGTIQGDAKGVAELTCARAFTAYAPHLSSITVTENLHAMIAAVGHNNIALPIQRYAATTAQLSRTTAFAAHAAHESTIVHTKYLNAAIKSAVMNKHVPVAVNRHTAGADELPNFAAVAADSANVRAVTVAQHLDSMVTPFGYNDITIAIQRDAVWLVELAGSYTVAADGPEEGAVADAKHLQAIVDGVSDYDIACVVQSQKSREFKMLVRGAFEAKRLQECCPRGGDAAHRACGRCSLNRSGRKRGRRVSNYRWLRL